MCNISLYHCRGLYYREFAFKTLPGESQAELLRLKYAPVRKDSDLQALVSTYRNRPGLYISIYSFSSLTESETIDYSSAKINRIYLDFDDADNPQAAISEALITAKVLSRHGIFTHCYFSGGKGIAMYIEFVTNDIRPQNKKEVLAALFDLVLDTVNSEAENWFGMWIPATCANHGFGLRTLDRQVRGDIARVSRLPNTKHKSGLFCIPLTFGDMRKGIDHIRQRAQQPRDIDLENIIAYNLLRNELMPTIMRNLEKQVITNREKEQQAAEARKRARELSRVRYPARPGQITALDIEKAKSTPISEFLGHDKKVVCPLHHDTEPSLSIDHKKNLWHCFGCGKGGDVVTFVMESQHIDFRTAILTLTGRATA